MEAELRSRRLLKYGLGRVMRSGWLHADGGRMHTLPYRSAHDSAYGGGMRRGVADLTRVIFGPQSRGG